MSARLADLIQVATQTMSSGSRVRELASCLRGEEGFHGAFTRSDPLGDFEILLEQPSRSLFDPGVLARVLEQELSPRHDGGRHPGMPRQLVLDASVHGGERRLTVILLWDELGQQDVSGPTLLGGLLLDPDAPLLHASDFYSLLQVFQLCLSRELFSERLDDYRAGLELVNALQPPVLGGDVGCLERALTQFRRILPFDVVALAFTEGEERTQIRYLFPARCPPRFVRDVKREMREALGIQDDEQVEEHYHNEAGGESRPVGERSQSLLILPLLGGRGQDCGRIGFFSGATDFFTDHHLRLLGLLAPSIGLALQSLRDTEALENRAANLETAKAQVEAQLELARRLQGGLLSPCPRPPEEIRVAQRSDMSAAVGGDFYAARQVSRHRYALAIADVSGKGLPAGIVMAHTLGALRAVWEVNPDPVQVMRRLNRSVLEATDDYSFVTAQVLLLDTRKGEISFSCAGHEPAVRLTRRGEIQEFHTGDPPLGILPDHPFSSGVIPFEEGDRLLLFTDGVLDAKDPSGERYGRERLLALLRNPASGAEELQESIFAGLDGFRQGTPAPDDATTLVLERRRASPSPGEV